MEIHSLSTTYSSRRFAEEWKLWAIKDIVAIGSQNPKSYHSWTDYPDSVN